MTLAEMQRDFQSWLVDASEDAADRLSVHAAAGLAGEAFPLRPQKGRHIGFGLPPVLYKVHVVMLQVAFIQLVDSGAGETAAFKAPSVPFPKGTRLFRAVHAAFPGVLLFWGPATGAGVLFVQKSCAGKANDPARG